MQEEEIIIGFDALYNSEGKCAKGVCRKASVGRFHLFRLAQLIKAGEKPASALYEQYGSWKAHAAKGNSQQLLQRMDQYVKTLLEGITT